MNETCAMRAPMNQNKDNTVLGVAVIVATVFTMALADAVIKYASAAFPLWQIFVVRSLLAVPMLVVIALCTNADIRPRSPPWAIARGLLLAFMYVAIYAAIPRLSLSVIAAALYTGPIFVALLSACVTGEKVGACGWVAVVLGFAGVLVILRPHTDAFSFYMLIPVIAGLFYALTYLLFAAFWGFVFFAERPDSPTIAGMLMIALAGLLVTGCIPMRLMRR